VVDTVSTLEALGEVQLAAQASGRIQTLVVRQGDQVRQGQLLMVLDQAQAQADVARPIFAGCIAGALDGSISAFGALLDTDEGFLGRGEGVVAIQFGDPANADFFRAGGLALILIGAVAEAFFVHLADHA
jgi:pyruvate/2-oxoglutarate dehydrogenase complex dihydrolipoamide acyltransferase (E2) component